MLIVDDQRLLREGLRLMLRSTGEIELAGEAEDGEQALALLARLDRNSALPDVVLMDIQMPVLDGVRATAAIRETYPCVRVIMLTTFDDDELVFEGLRSGACGYLLKDVTAEGLLEAIKAAARGESSLQPSIAAKVVAEFSRLSGGAARLAAANSRLDQPLTERELAVLAELGQGKSNREIAAAVHLSAGTVRNRVTSILAKLDVCDRTQAALKAQGIGLLAGS